MERINEVNESQYKVDFMITDNYINFSSELLRLSLLAIGGVGSLLMLTIKGDALAVFINPLFFILSLVFFVICCAASLFHRYYVTDSMSWYVAFLRARNHNDATKADKEKKGFYNLLRRTKWSLITSEISFALGVLLFFIAISNLFIQ